MKNCVVKMVVKSRGRTNPEEAHTDPADELLSTQTVNASRTMEEKESLGVQLKSLMGSFEKMFKEMSKSGKVHEIEPRDRKIIWDLPLLRQGEKLKKQQLEQWITGLCNEVFSAAFHYFETGRMNYDQSKIYCSQNMISNIMRLSQAYQLTPDQMKQIDQHIQEGISPYLLSKYPMNETMVVNKALEAEVKETDNIQALQNDIFFYEDNSFGFQYRESGIYNDLIMRLINHLMARIDEKEGNNKNVNAKTFYQQFYQTMQTTFEKIESREEMQGRSDSKDQLAKRTDAQKYRARVKSYTSYAIGRKISENVNKYTPTQIESMHMTIKSPAILRILTKWCEQLWTKFEKKNYFLDRTENVKCQKGRNVNTYFAWMKEIINKMIEDEKGEIERFLEQVFANNYDQQAIHCFRSLRANNFSHVEKFEKAAGIFTVNIVNNLHSYIILYLNRIIHGLLKVSKRVYDKELIGKARWPSPPNLISFKIGDLMRCKIGSQQREILWLFRKLSEYSERRPEFLKIIRIKNRLKEGTNDILMNVRFKNQFICEVQLAVNSDHSNFIKCSNKYNHFIYQVKRSIFGPITELCSIWRSLDGRCKIYEKMADSKKNKVGQLQLKSSCQLQGRAHEMRRYFQPFVCSTCHETYSHCNYIWPHKRCERCNIFTQCCKCQIAAQNENELKEKLLKTTELKNLATRLKREDEIPKYGLCVLIQSKQINIQKFIKLNVKSKLGLYCRRGKGQINLITDLTSKKEIQAFKDKYIIFKLPNDPKVKNMINISQTQAKNEFVLPKLIKSNYKKEKQYISLIGENIDDEAMAKILEGSQSNHAKIRSMQLPDNNISKIDFICKDFPNLNKLVLSRNQISEIDAIGNLISLTQLNIRDNQITELPPNLFRKLPKLQSLNLRNNKFNVIPQEIELLTDLTKLQLNQLSLKELPKSLGKMKKLQYIDLDKNQLGEIPEQLRSLTNLSHLALSKNGIKEVPDWIGQLKALRQLQLNKNKISNLPVTLADIPNLVELELNQNNFQKLNFKCPDSLNSILLNQSKIQEIGDVFFANCKNLVKIQLNNNSITNLPRNLGINCTKVKSLSLNNNKISELPSLFGIFLPALELIQLENNSIKQFPRALTNCYELVELHLANNPEFDDIIPVTFLDNNFKLQGLDFSGTKLSRIPRQIGLASTLKRINLTGTSVTCENLQVIEGLQFLEQLILASMNLTSLPQSLKSQHSLHVLNVSNNKLTSIDDDFFTKLTHLRTLNFGKNQLKTIPNSFQACKRVRGINFTGNQITEFPSAIFEFSKIEKIIFSSNQITTLDSKGKYLPASVILFDLSDNQITQVSDNFFERAESLQELNLSKNKLKNPPKFIRDCEHLTRIDFNDNLMEIKAEDAIRETLLAFITNEDNDEEEEVIFNKENLMNTFLGG